MTILRCYSNLNLQLWKAKLKLVLRNNWISLIRKGAVAFQSRIPSHCGKISPVMDGAKIIIKLLGDLARFLWLSLRPQCSLAAENLFLRKQLALFQERNAKPRRPDTPIRIALVLLSRLFHWRDALVIVQPQTLVRWHRQGFRLFWRWKSRPGHPPIPVELRQLIREMAVSNPSWAKSALPMNYCSNSVFACRHVRYESTYCCVRQGILAGINAGRASFAIMLRPSWPVTSASL